jgi:hypothetical protein
MVDELFDGDCTPEKSDARERLEGDTGDTGAEYEPRLNPLRQRLPVSVADLGLNRVFEGTGLDRAVRNGRDIVVTKIDCFSRALSDTPNGKKFRMESNGRWNASAGGRGTPDDFVVMDDNVRRLFDFSADASCSLESCGELGALPDVNRNTLGGGNEAAPEVISMSVSNDS